jgi:hypothetical protein
MRGESTVKTIVEHFRNTANDLYEKARSGELLTPYERKYCTRLVFENPQLVGLVGKSPFSSSPINRSYADVVLLREITPEGTGVMYMDGVALFRGSITDGLIDVEIHHIANSQGSRHDIYLNKPWWWRIPGVEGSYAGKVEVLYSGKNSEPEENLITLAKPKGELVHLVNTLIGQKFERIIDDARGAK